MLKTDPPLVTFVIPSYNHAPFVYESIKSVIEQDYQNIELIIIDDGSKDNSVQIIEQLIPDCHERFVRFEFRSRENKGLCATLNEALEWSQGEYFSPLASDDVAYPEKTSFLVSKIINTDLSAVFGNIRRVGEEKEVYNFPLYQNEYEFEDLFLHKKLPPTPGVLLRTSDILDVGGYSEKVVLEDWYMWLKLTQRGKRIVSFDRVVSIHRRHDNNTVKDKELMHRAREEVIKHFSNEPLYKAALRNNNIMHARLKQTVNTRETILLLLKSRSLRKQSLRILIITLTPNYIRKKTSFKNIMKL